VPNPPDLVEFDAAEPQVVLERMSALAATHSGWINLEPALDREKQPVVAAGIFRVFSGSGPPVPFATWTPGERRRRGEEPPSVGILHAAGPKAVQQLAAAGAQLPDRWVLMQDHPKRGLVVAVPPDEDHATVLAWVFRAAAVLSQVPVPDRWRAFVYAGSSSPS
jgi:hypothetical protein